ncbi:coiled-coil domain-containing protein 61-like isoform X2 [Cimex lectularius]|uniref:Uncharacterized protein n=1 Tax=Cimex lectularius TaxID=79782 RepID=A0A8I6RSW4_CIMLE|nr:coiled-coil domain-containing protein 61-like isoform X2 [Cimex lectularius]
MSEPLKLNCSLKERHFTLALFLTSQSVELHLEDKSSKEKWVSSLVPSYIENMTKRTGNYKNFHTFSEMLKALFKGTSTSMDLELVYQKDLEAMGSNRSINIKGPKYAHIKSGPTGAVGNNLGLQSNTGGKASKEEDNLTQRIYIIIIYSGEFDKTHYPIPLDYQGYPNIQVMYGSIEHLQKENVRLRKELQTAYVLIKANTNDKIPHVKHHCSRLSAQTLRLLKQVDAINKDLVDLVGFVMENQPLLSKESEDKSNLQNNRIALLEAENQLLNILYGKQKKPNEEQTSDFAKATPCEPRQSTRFDTASTRSPGQRKQEHRKL